MTKWFARSRALWAGLIPLLVVVLPWFGIAADGLEQQLVELGNQAELTIAQLLLLISGALALWHKFRPDTRQQTLLPTLPAGSALWLWLFVLAAVPWHALLWLVLRA